MAIIYVIYFCISSVYLNWKAGESNNRCVANIYNNISCNHKVSNTTNKLSTSVTQWVPNHGNNSQDSVLTSLSVFNVPLKLILFCYSILFCSLQIEAFSYLVEFSVLVARYCVWLRFAVFVVLFCIWLCFCIYSGILCLVCVFGRG